MASDKDALYHSALKIAEFAAIPEVCSEDRTHALGFGWYAASRETAASAVLGGGAKDFVYDLRFTTPHFPYAAAFGLCGFSSAVSLPYLTSTALAPYASHSHTRQAQSYTHAQ